MTSARNAVFLAQMGLGPLWLSRQPLASVVMEAVALPAPEVIEPVQSIVQVAPPIVAATEADWFDAVPLPTPIAAQAIAALDWPALKAAAASCTRCELCQGRTGVVFGRGALSADWLMVGSAPSRADEKSATPFSGEAGKLLDNMLLAAGLNGAQVYFTNVVKCRSAHGVEGVPTAQQVAACRPFLERELALTSARTVLTLGHSAAASLLASPAPARGVVRQFGACTVVATDHPADLLRDGAGKAAVWLDLNLAKSVHQRDE